MNIIGEVCKKEGIIFVYYNYDFEFEVCDNKIFLDVLIIEIDFNFVVMEFDLYWMVKVGKNLIDYFK